MRVMNVIRSKVVSRLPPWLRFPIERFYYYHFVKNYVENEAMIIKRFCQKDMDSIDIGANQGQLTLFLSGYSSHVYCFEPVKSMYQILTRRFSGSNVTVENCAIGDFNGESEISIPFIDGQMLETRSSIVQDFDDEYVMGTKITGVDKVRIDVRRLDDFKFGNIGFIKIDVEGFELEVLVGARETIIRNKPAILIEIEQRFHKGTDISYIFKSIEDLGYYGYFVYDAKLRRIDDFDLDSMQDRSNERTNRYVSNFLFTPARQL